MFRADLCKISAVTDAVALPTAMTAALTAAKGSYMHSTLNAGKGAVSGLGKLAFGGQESMPS